MAATGTPTPNLGLRIPVGTDPASVDDINYNSNLLDTKLGAIGNDSVQDQITTLNSKVAKYYYSKADVTLAGNSDTAISVPLPSSYSQILAIIPVGYNVASTWNTTLVIKGVDNAGSASVRTNGTTQQVYSIWFWVIYR